MARYAILFSLTDDALAALLKNPRDGKCPLRKLLETAGGKLESSYWVFGEYDGIAIVELLNATAVVAVCVAGLSAGALQDVEAHALISLDSLATIAERASGLQPDVISADVALPNTGGAEWLERIRQTGPTMRPAMPTAYDTDERIVEAVQAGARGYPLNGGPRHELLAGLRVFHQSRSLLHPSIAGRVRAHRGRLLDREQPVEPLTEREMEVLRSMAQGARNKDIATQLCITERTVKFHLGAIFQKLGARSRTETLAKAVHYGLVQV